MKRLLTFTLSALLLAGCASAKPVHTVAESKPEDSAVSENAMNSASSASSEAMANASDAGDGDTKNMGTENAGAPGSDTAQAGEELVIKHALGEIRLPKKPERIVTVGWENQDTPLALGVAPVGVSAANYGLVSEDKLHPWTKEAFTALGVEHPNVFNDLDGLNYEAISNAEPDVILAAYSGITQEEYDILSKIAPVLAYENAPWQTKWREQTIQNARGMGMEAEGRAKVAETEQLIAEKLAAYPELKAVSTGFFWINPGDFSKFYAYLPNDPRASYLNDLGLATPQSILDMAGETEDFSVTLSSEQVEKFSDVQMMVVYGDEALLKELQADPLMSKIPAVRDGAVVLINPESALAGAATPSILSIPHQIDTYLGLLHEAQQKIKG